ncbi:MAG: hypothetical protein AAF485_28955, partial [Chloroflexota bacterium]
MKSLKDALVDYDLALLQGIADRRGLDPPANRNPETLSQFCDALLSPVMIAFFLEDITAEEKEALLQLIAAGNQLESQPFSRQYGEIRSMGPGRLRREKPWQHPQNVAESLWYQGLIFKGFQHTINGPQEVIFIPDELQLNLPFIPHEAPSFQLHIASAPKFVLANHLPVKEDMFTFLVYLHTNIVRLTQDDEIPADQVAELLGQYSQIGLEEIEFADRWQSFILHLARRLNFLAKQGQRLKLNVQVVRDWLQKSSWQQIGDLQNTWRSDPTWNDLWHAPGLYPKATGWENSPLLARSKILHYLSQLPSGEWFSIRHFQQALKKTEPDFQRPNGDYQSWYIYDAQGEPLMGFDHWDKVEGGLIHYILTTILGGFGVVELGAPAERVPATLFRITPFGESFLLPDTPYVEPEIKRPPVLGVNAATFTIRVPNEASLYDRFQLARFAQLHRREEKRMLYKITRESYLKALEQSISLEQ